MDPAEAPKPSDSKDGDGHVIRMKDLEKSLRLEDSDESEEKENFGERSGDKNEPGDLMKNCSGEIEEKKIEKEGKDFLEEILDKNEEIQDKNKEIQDKNEENKPFEPSHKTEAEKEIGENNESKNEANEEEFEVLGEESRTFYLFARTSREKEEWFNRFTVGANFLRDWNRQNPQEDPKNEPKSDPKSENATRKKRRRAALLEETHKVKEQKFRMFMENYFQVRFFKITAYSQNNKH